MSNFLTSLKQFKPITLFLLISVIGLEVAAQNQSAFLKLFAAQSLAIPEKLIAIKKTKVGQLDIEQLLAEIKTLTWMENAAGVFQAGSGETRTGAIYDVEKRTITLNSGRAQFEPKDTMSIASLHEALGALGYIDENYQLSLLLKIHSLTDQERSTIFDEQDFNRENIRFLNLEKRTKNFKYVMAGGATSVGGGGDGIVVQLKWYLLLFGKQICQISKLNCLDVFRRVLDANIEINPKVIETTVRSEIIAGKRIIRIPMIAWINGSIQTNGQTLADGQIQIMQETMQHLMQEIP